MLCNVFIVDINCIAYGGFSGSTDVKQGKGKGIVKCFL